MVRNAIDRVKRGYSFKFEANKKRKEMMHMLNIERNSYEFR